jgi:hypothetical protein
MPNERDDDLLDDESRKYRRLESVPEDFVNKVKASQGEVLKNIEDLVSQLETENGVFVFNERNLSLINSIDQKLKDTVFSDEYIDAVKKFASEFNVQAGLNNAYFAAIDPTFEPTALYTQVLRSTQKNAIDLLGEDAFTQKLINPLKQILESSITNGQTFNEALSSLRYVIAGDDTIDGAMTSYVKRVAYDGFAVSDRGYTNVIAQDLELEFYRYSGGIIKDSRCFCIERHGKFFHKKEIEEWGEQKNLGKCNIGGGWAGMNSATDKATIFYFAGGYNCGHSFLPVSVKSVPKDVISRNLANGNYKPKKAA